MCRVLEANGWILLRTRGSHFAYQSPNGNKTIIVPVHGNRDLRTGTQRAIMRDAGITDNDL
jgi:predicted RNA binding protein YcfA (HicA-like mRNA interferase family)